MFPSFFLFSLDYGFLGRKTIFNYVPTGDRPGRRRLRPRLFPEGHKGKTVRLADYKDKENVLLAFYRGESDIYSINWLKKLDEDYLEIRALDYGGNRDQRR